MAENDQPSRLGWLHSVLVSVLVALLAGGTSPWWWSDLKAALRGNPAGVKPEATVAADQPGIAGEPQAKTPPADQPGIPGKDMLEMLGKVGVTFSVDREAVAAWLNDDSTPYPAIGLGLLELLKGRQLSRPVPLDGIVYDYQRAGGTTGQGRVDLALLKTAVLLRYNTEYGASLKDFGELTK